MEQSAPTGTPSGEHTSHAALLADPRLLANPLTIGGGVTLVVGLVLTLVPALSHELTEIVVGLGLLTSGLNDLWSAARRRHLRAVARVTAAVRGLASIALAVVFIVWTQAALDVTILLGALYLLLRSLLTLLLALLSRDRTRRAPRLASGAVGLALAILIMATPEQYTDWIAAGVGLAAVAGGVITLAFGYRIATGEIPRPAGLYPSFTEILWSWVEHADVGEDRRTDLADQLYLERPEIGAKRIAWWTMLVLSVAIATLAVLQDSTAVVIGAMLVAPLMTPILGLAAALVSGWATRALRSLGLIVAGVVVAVGLAFVISSWVPAVVPFDSNSQIASRVSPTLLDMFVALAAGAAGAFATADRRVASSLGGVAIAVALVPPLSVVGVSLGAGRPDDAAGAMLLFATNFVSIVLAAAVMWVLTGVADPTALRHGGRRILVTLAPFVAAALLVLLPLLLTTDGLLTTTSQQRSAQDAVSDWLDDAPTLRLADVTVSGDTVEVSLDGPSDDLPELTTLRSSLTDALGQPVAVEVEVTPVVTQWLPAAD
jgi:uncharacterized hydrophobic protein (TIGR00271 family)